MFLRSSTFEENKIALSKLTKAQSVHFSVHVAKSVLYVWENSFPEDLRPRLAIKAAENWLVSKSSSSARNAAAAAYAAADAMSGTPVGADAATHSAATAYAAANVTSGISLAAYAAYAAANAVRAATINAADGIKGKWSWISKLYSSIYKEQPFPRCWKTADTISIALAIRASSNLKEMPILADALEDANCADYEILNHLRNEEDLWCKGSWVLVNLTESKE